ncbi:MAG: hypothetical protein KDJ20_12085, partial [Hyphomicrobiales bacterium]|nr:hypothetical protein [Hyphomicrobiales bacterium]
MIADFVWNNERKLASGAVWAPANEAPTLRWPLARPMRIALAFRRMPIWPMEKVDEGETDCRRRSGPSRRDRA